MEELCHLPVYDAHAYILHGSNFVLRPRESHFGLRCDNIYSNGPGKVEWIIPEILEFLETSSVPTSTASPKVSIYKDTRNGYCTVN
jgi:hypothetical protein